MVKAYSLDKQIASFMEILEVPNRSKRGKSTRQGKKSETWRQVGHSVFVFSAWLSS